MKLRLALVAFVALLGVAGYFYYIPRFTTGPPASFGPPLRVGNSVYLLTGQSHHLSSRRSELHVDVWAFDATTVAPRFRRRLQTIPGGATYGRNILGAHEQTLWLLLPDGPHAVDLSSGASLANADRLAEINPQLRGLIPTESQYFSFTTTGLAVKTADARTWHFHPSTFVALPAAPATATAIRPAFITPKTTALFLERGFVIRDQWFGLLTPAEAATFGQYHSIGGLDFSSRRSLYTADITMLFLGGPRYSNFRPLGPEFLAPGLLAEFQHAGPGKLIVRPDPESIFVLHLDRLGDNGRLLLARVAGPSGQILWNVDLPLSYIQSVLPGEQSLVLFGRQNEFQDPNDPTPRDPYHTAHEMLVAVDWKTGKVSTHDQHDITRHPPALPPLEK